MSRIIIQKRSLSHRKSISCEDDSRFQLRALLTTIKHHQTHRPEPIPRSIYHSGFSQEPQQELNNARSTQKKYRLPRISPNRNQSNINKLNSFEHHIIHNYLNVHLKIVQGDSEPLKRSKTKRKINKRKNKIKYTTNKHGENTTVQQAQLQTLNNGSRYESIQHNTSLKKQSKKQYSLKQQPMKHYVHQKLQRKKRQWKQNSPLDLLTYFAMAYEKTGTKTENGIPKHVTTTQKVDSKIPNKSELSHFIKHYLPRNKDIKMLQLIKKQTFTIDFGEQSFYFGQATEGNRQGLGVQIKNGYKFEGKWLNGQKNKGIEITQFGTYNGLFKNDKKEGKGQFNWANGQFYSGEWRDGKRDGVGLWTSPKGDSYMGEWKKGVVEGQGVHKTSSGQRYQGAFRNFLKHGFGKQSFPNGDKYEGSYVQGLPNGISTYSWANGTVYEGNFINGYRTGKGTLANDKGFLLKGQFLKEKADGACQIDYGDGEIYNGEMRDGKRNGKGTLRNKAKHRIFDGYWKDNEFASLDEIK